MLDGNATIFEHIIIDSYVRDAIFKRQRKCNILYSFNTLTITYSRVIKKRGES